MPRKKISIDRLWRPVRVTALGLSLAVASNGGLHAEGLFSFGEYFNDGSGGQILLTSAHGDCPCPQPHSCKSDCFNPCQPEAVESPSTEKPPAETLPLEPSNEMGDLGASQPDYGALATMGGARGSAGLGSRQNYIDEARIRSRVRVRYDNLQGANEPTRAEYLYPTIGAFGGPGPTDGAGTNTANPSSEVDFQELSTYIEAAFGPRFSVFGEFPARWVDSVDFPNSTVFDSGVQAGAGDFRAAGLRFGIIACQDEWLTLQVRAWAPTGDARQALGVGHSSIDTSLLYEVRPSSRTSLFGEIQDWQSIDAGTASNGNETVDLDGNVLRYGGGIGYDFWQSCGCRPRALTAVFEVVGWTVLDGVVTSLDPNDSDPFQDAEGDTIVNGKYGVRYSDGRHSVGVSYGNNWTSERWYSDIVRVEWQFNF